MRAITHSRNTSTRFTWLQVLIGMVAVCRTSDTASPQPSTSEASASSFVNPIYGEDETTAYEDDEKELPTNYLQVDNDETYEGFD